MTKADLVDWDATDVISREKEFVGALGLRGAEHRYMKCTNYCNDTAPDRTEHVYPKLDINILRFMVQLCDPAIAVTHDKELLYPDPPVQPDPKSEAPVEPGIPPKPEVNWQYIKMALAIAGWIIVVLVVIMLDSCRFKRRVANACTINKEYSNEAMPKEFAEICDSQNGGLMEIAFTLGIGGILAVVFAARRFGIISDIQRYLRQN